MLHRAGNVDGEGDGCGLLVDIPTKIWAEEVRQGGHNPSLALDDAFAVAHVFVERSQDLEKVRHGARELLGKAGFRILAERVGAVDSAALGPTAREEEPQFWQFAGLVPEAADADRSCFNLKVVLEEKLGVHVASFSGRTGRLQGDGQPEGARRLLPGPLRRALRDDRRLRAQPLLDQHLAVVHPGPALRRPRPQRRDQHDRAAPPGGADARRADRRGQLGLPGPEPHDRDAGPPPRPHRSPRRWRWWCRRSSTRSPRCPRSSTPSTCTCARRWAPTRRARSR